MTLWVYLVMESIKKYPMLLWVYIAVFVLVVSLPALFIGWLAGAVAKLLSDKDVTRKLLSDEEEVERYWRNRELKCHQAETKTRFWHFDLLHSFLGGLYVVVVFVALALLVRLIP